MQQIIDNVKLVYQAINNLTFIPEGVEREELEQIGKIALFNALKSYKSNNGYSLSTHCYRFIYYQLLTYLKNPARKKRQCIKVNIDDHTIATNSIEEDEDYTCDILMHEIGKYIPELDREIFFDKFVVGMTYDELSTKYNLTVKQLRGIINKSKDILQEKIKWKED